MTATHTEPVVTDGTGSDDELVHLVCCSDNDYAWCGLDVSDQSEDPTAPEHDECIVCVHMVEAVPVDTHHPQCKGEHE